MSDDMASDHASFAFWSKGEMARIAMIAGLVAYPISVSAVNGPAGVAGKPEHAIPQQASKLPAQPGRLRSVRVVDFDIAKLGLKALGDLDDTER
jgi:hypothetical protein